MYLYITCYHCITWMCIVWLFHLHYTTRVHRYGTRLPKQPMEIFVVPTPRYFKQLVSPLNRVAAVWAHYYSQLIKRSHLQLVPLVAKTCTNMSSLVANTSHPLNSHYNSNPDTI